LEEDQDILKSDLSQILELTALINKAEVLPTDLLQYKEIFRRYGDFQYLPIKELIKISQFMGVEPVTGVNIINNILKIFKLEIPVDSFIVRDIAK